MAKRTTTPATRGKAAPPAAVQDYGDLAGAGYQNTGSDDFAIPFLAIMQSNSPQVESEEHPAKIGNLFNTVTEELIDPKDGVVLTPCHTEHLFVEWRTRDQGGGFVQTHALDSDVAVWARENCEFGEFKTPEGNDLSETFYMYCMSVSDSDVEQGATPSNFVVVAFTGTKIRPYKRIMGRLRMFKGNPPLFAHRLKFSSVAEENSKGKYRNFHIEPAIDNDVQSSLIPAMLDGNPHPVLLAGLEFGKQIEKGLARPSHETAAREPGQESGDEEDAF